ncbi:ATP-binding protein [Burkholderia cenocepacia]|uniref:ATP-binding protein n=1 Tax=Burkholderia cenocepacia TaxID=95486 RepID=UPI00222EC96D|nr:ATP-binding protein [Burkholderia cenocepacia]MCW3608529.1 ATP-binding protein [Burkholderia cenocepacia]MCW5186953.1 ATP-binding protein [Burkholderia cenocepacia]
MPTPRRRAVSGASSQSGRETTTAVTEKAKAAKSGYHLRISRLTVDKLGVKLYDKASAVVAELIANSYDADAETVTVRLPLGIQLASKAGGQLQDLGHVIDVEDNGHGMAPEEAIDFYLRVGADRRTRKGQDGSRSRNKKRPVMGRKGIGKLAPFGICRRIEVWSAGGPETKNGYAVTHFFMDFDKIVTDDDDAVPLDVGDEDRTWSKKPGTRIRLTMFLAKRVPDLETFLRQLAVRFTFAKPDFKILIVDTTNDKAKPVKVNPLDIPLLPGSKIDLSTRPVIADDGSILPVSGWLGMAKEAYKNEEMMGVRIYARGKIAGVTRDFNQPAGFTGEFAMRSYLVGQVEAEWLDLDQGDDLVRTDRQDILWDSDYGQLLRQWGAELIKEIARISREPRRIRVRDEFLRKSKIEERARERFGDKQVSRVAIDLAKKFGGFAAEDELNDDVYVEDLSQIILSVAPHQALMEAFHEFSNQVTKGEASIEQMLDIFSKAQLAELASYAQIAAQRVRVIKELEQIIDVSMDENQFQSLIASAPWLIEPSWTVITKNQSLKNFKNAFEKFWKKEHGTVVTLAIDHEVKRPDFTLVSIDGLLHIVEIKKAGHAFDDTDFSRLINYVDAFDNFFLENEETVSEFYRGWRICLVADGERLKQSSNQHAYKSFLKEDRVKRMSWRDFLMRAKKVHEQFLDVYDLGAEKRKGKSS